MRQLCVTVFVVVCVLQAVSLVEAFTNGTLLPDYICHPNTDGLPHSLGGYLPQVKRLSINPLQAFAPNQDPNAISQTTQYILANWHNRNDTVPCKAVFQVNTSVTLGTTTILNQIVPGQVHQLTLIIRGHDFVNLVQPLAGSATCDVPLSQVTPADINNLALDGAIIYASDSTGHRVGFFVSLGTADATTLVFQPACGPWGMGVVHNQLLSGTGTYAGLTWAAPGYLAPGNSVTFAGAGVSDAGFGAHSTTLPIVALPTALLANAAVATPVITYATWVGSNLVVFFDPETMPGVGGSASVTASGYTVTVTGATTVQQPTSASPAQIPWSSLTGLAGATVAITVQAQGGTGTVAGTAATSVAYGITLPLTAPSATVTVTQATSICNATYIDHTNFFSMYQNDNQCSWQGLLLASGTVSGTKITSAASSLTVGPVQIFIILGAMAAAMLSIFQPK